MPINMKAVIADAFVSLAQRKNVDKITVKDLVEACGISRQTFYYHFQDILEVIEWSMQQAMQEMLAQSLAVDDTEKALRIFITAAAENQEIIKKLMHSQRREQVERMMFHAIQDGMMQLARDKAPHDLSFSDLEMAVHFYTYGIVGLLLEYSSMKQLDINRFAHQLNLLLSGRLINFN